MSCEFGNLSHFSLSLLNGAKKQLYNYKSSPPKGRQLYRQNGWMFTLLFHSLVTHAASPQKIKTSDRLTQLHFKLKCERLLGGDRDIGEVNVPVKEFLDSTKNGSTQFVTYQLVMDKFLSGPQGPYPHEQHHKATTGNSSLILVHMLSLMGLRPTPYPPPGPYLPGDHWATIGTPQSHLNVSYTKLETDKFPNFSRLIPL
ncbi:hypothetical protein ACFE04_008237 [Oxalis oulophora]